MTRLVRGSIVCLLILVVILIVLNHLKQTPQGQEYLSVWHKSNLTFSISNCPSSMDCAQAKQILRQVIAVYDAASGLEFTEVEQGGDIVYAWVDRLPNQAEFDGLGGVVATTGGLYFSGFHAVEGNVYFDAFDIWTATQTDYLQTPLYPVALHETGHALGLGHSNNPASVMFEEYPMWGGQVQLTFADLAAIQDLYGPD